MVFHINVVFAQFQKNFDLILGILWETVVRCMYELMLHSTTPGPSFFYQNRYANSNKNTRSHSA